VQCHPDPMLLPDPSPCREIHRRTPEIGARRVSS